MLQVETTPGFVDVLGSFVPIIVGEAKRQLLNDGLPSQAFGEQEEQQEGDVQMPRSCEFVGIDSGARVEDVVLEFLDQKDLRKQNEPFYLINLSQLVRQIDQWKELFPSVTPFYAIKSNPDPRFLELMYCHGCGFDCASRGEIGQVLDIMRTNDPKQKDRIIFAHPIKKPGDLLYAKEQGVRKITVDSMGEMEKLKSLDLLDFFEVVIRIKTDDSKSMCRFSSKFGCDLDEGKAILDFAKKEKRLKLVRGVSFHVGSGCNDPLSYRKALEDAKDLFRYGLNLGIHMNLIDLGGGFSDAVEDEDGEVKNLLCRTASTVNESLEDLFYSDSDFNEDLTVIAEPGRYFCAPVATLVVQVIGKKVNQKGADGDACEDEMIYYLSDGVYGSFNNIIFDHYQFDAQIVPSKNNTKKGGDIRDSTFFGVSCDGLDTIWKGKFKELNIMDYLYFKNFGAYTMSASCPFNGYITDNKLYYWTEKT